MKALVTLDTDGHFGVVCIEDEAKELQVLRDLMMQVVEDRFHFNDEQKAEAYRLAHTGTIDEITEWMDDGDLRMGRSGGARIDLIEVQKQVPKGLVSNLIL